MNRQPDMHTTFEHIPAGEEHNFYPSPEARLEQAREKSDVGANSTVCVIGGGIAGLVAAFELQKAGLEVHILEHADRLGGRIWTHAWGSGGLSSELGAMRIPESHEIVNHYVRLMGLGLIDFGDPGLNSHIFFRGRLVRRRNVEGLKAATVTPRGRPATSNPFDIRDEIADQFEGQLRSNWRRSAFGLEGLPVFASDDALAAAENGSVWSLATGPLWQNLDSGNPSIGRVTVKSEEWEAIGKITGDVWFDKMSVLQWLVDGPRSLNGGMNAIAGGMGGLVASLVQKLRSGGRTQIDVGSTVTAVRVGRKVTVRWRKGDGTLDVKRFDHVVCAVPAAATAAIDFRPPLEPPHLDALANMTYMRMAKAAILCSSRPWEPRILGGVTRTDLPIGQIWYPSDHLRVRGQGAGSYVSERTHDGRIAPLAGGAAPRSARPRDPGALLIYMWGMNAQRFGALTAADQILLLRHNLEKVHPGIGRTFQDQEVVVAPWNGADCGGGAFAYFTPGEQRRYQPSLTLWHPRDTPRVFFAGEHLLPQHGWIAPAIETAVTAVLNVLR